MIVNLDQFSELAGVTAETMRVYITAVEGDPSWLIERGQRGRGYKIDAEPAHQWWRDLRENEERIKQEDAEEFQQLRMNLIGTAAEDPKTLTLSGKQRNEEITATFAAIKLRRTMADLIERPEIEHTLTAAAVDLRRRLLLISREFVATQGLESSAADELKILLGRALDDFVTAITLPPRPSHAPIEATSLI